MDRDQYPWGELATYIDHAKVTLGLESWHIVVTQDPPSKDTNAAETSIPHGREWAQMAFGEKFWTAYDPSEQRETIYHELMHCVFARTWETVVTIREFLSPDAWNLFFENIKLSEEHLVDATAVAAAPFLAPLPKLKVGRRRAHSAPQEGRVVSSPTRVQGDEPETPPA